MTNDRTPFWSNSIEEIATDLKSNLVKGFSANEVETRLRKASSNTIAENQHVSDLRLLFNQFKSPFMALLLFADVLSFFRGTCRCLNHIQYHNFDRVFEFLAGKRRSKYCSGTINYSRNKHYKF